MARRIAVIGVGGRMGTEAARTVAATPDLELVAAIGRGAAGRQLGEFGVEGAAGALVVSDDLAAVTDADADIAIELTGPASVGAHLLWLLEHDVHAVVGATGLDDETLATARELAGTRPANALIAPNFAIGAVLLMRFAAEAARYLPEVEIVELHHDRKLDAPSGTALRTAELVDEGRTRPPGLPGGDDRLPGARGVTHARTPIHSVRLPGLLAHQEVLLGGAGQLLTIRHDSFDRSSFMPGIVQACRAVADLDGLAVGLEHVL